MNNKHDSLTTIPVDVLMRTGSALVGARAYIDDAPSGNEHPLDGPERFEYKRQLQRLTQGADESGNQ